MWIDRKADRKSCGVDVPTQGTKQKTQIVVFQTVADKQDRPGLHPRSDEFMNRMKMLGTHSLNKYNVILFCDDDGLGVAKITVKLQQHRLTFEWIKRH